MRTRRRSPFGDQLRHWRRARRWSQLELAAEANSTPRHISFLETGRSRPGRAIVLRLAESLDLSMSACNEMLRAAGLREEYGESSFDEASMAPLRDLVDVILTNHEPYPAWCMTREFHCVRANGPAKVLLPGVEGAEPERVFDLLFGSGPMSQLLENRVPLLHAARASLRREALSAPTPTLTRLLALVDDQIGDSDCGSPDIETPIVYPTFSIQGKRVRTVTTMMRFDNARDVAASELKIELVYPADEPSARAMRGLFSY